VRSIAGSQSARPAAPMGGGAGRRVWGGGNTVSSSHEEATDIRGVGAPRARGSPKPGASPAPTKQSLLSLLFKKKEKKAIFFFFFPEATSKVGIWPRQGRRRCSALPARPRCPPAKASPIASTPGIAVPKPPGPRSSAARARLGVPPAARHHLSPPRPPGFGPFRKMKSEHSAKRGEQGPGLPRRGSEVPEPHPSSIPTPSQFRPSAGWHLPRVRPGTVPPGHRRQSAGRGEGSHRLLNWSRASPCAQGCPPHPPARSQMHPGGSRCGPRALPAAGQLLVVTHVGHGKGVQRREPTRREGAGGTAARASIGQGVAAWSSVPRPPSLLGSSPPPTGPSPPPPGQKSWGGGGQHTPMHPQTLDPLPP